MKMNFQRLILHVKEGDFEIPFSNSISYFYGKMGAGKSTIPRLINFCLGGSIRETPALQHEFVSVSLELNIGEYHVKLERQRRSNEVMIAWRKGESVETEAAIVPTQATKGESVIKGKKIENISDLIFHLAGSEPPFVPRAKTTLETELVRLSFRDLMWYCYLDQDHIDSSFFYLETGDDVFRKNKSRDAMRHILGFRHEKIAKLEADFNQTRHDKASRDSSVEQLRSFLEDNGIQGTKDILDQISKFEINLNDIVTQINQIHKLNLENIHPVDKLKEKSRELTSTIDRINERLDSLEFQVVKHDRLKSEFITANMRIDRISAARAVFKNIQFVTCPQCGQNLEHGLEHDSCLLCKQPVKKKSFEDVQQISPDLKDRIKEIEDSVNRLHLEKKQLQLTLRSRIREKREVDARLEEEERNYDSKYLTQASELLQKKGVIEGKIQALQQMLPLPKRVDELENESAELTVKIEKLGKELEREKDRESKNLTILKKLEKIFADTLIQVRFPGILEDDVVTISPDNFIPIIRRKGETHVYTTFSNLGSGGKKTIFKACFALALHRLAAKNGETLPTFLIIDTPMKNTSERENKDVFVGFYHFLYKLIKTELKGRQIIIIDKEYYKDPEEQISDIVVRHMTPDSSDAPPLIPYYSGH